MQYPRLFLVLLFLVGTSLSCQEKKLKKLEQVLQSELDKITSHEQIPGANLSIALPNDKTVSVASGWADIEKAQTMTTDRVLFSGSVGKTYAMALVLKLVEQGRLNLDDKVQQLFQDEDWFLRIPNASDLTIRMLLNHTSGIPRYVFKADLWTTVKENPDKVWTGKERLSYIFDDPPVHEAGKGWAYSDTNYIILGMIIEKLTGKDYYDFLQEEILDPLGLKNTFASNKRNLPRLASGYTRPQFKEQFGFPLKVTEDETYCMNPQLEWTGGGINYTAADLARWGQLLYAGKVLSPEMTKAAKTPAPFDTGFRDGAGYGFATFVWEQDGTKSYGHTGFMFGYVAIVEYIPKYDAALALLINTDNLPQGHTLNAYLNQIKEQLAKELEQI